MRRYSKTTRSSTGNTTRGGWTGSFSPQGSSYSKRTASFGKTNGGRTASGIAPGYKQISNAFAAKVRSFRTLQQHTKGAAGQTRPSTATFKSFCNWINKGANVWFVTNSKVNSWCNTGQKLKTGGAAKNALGKKFGKSTIKAVSCSKGGFLVAAAPTCKGKSFVFPN
jgi:hypothetical protein